jgi:NAD(P)-dependent dehydrogenase (short-subunit alcohol dehydrogenase family)
MHAVPVPLPADVDREVAQAYGLSAPLLPDGRAARRGARRAAGPRVTALPSAAMHTAVVTGAGRGMGRETARRLVARGYAVLVTDVDEQAARETAEQLGPNAWAMAQDVRDPDSHRQVAKAAAERGPLKVWVNNAGVLRTDKTWDHSDDEARLMVEANLLGVIWGARAALEAMRADPGGAHIINMASMASFGPVPGLAVYGATKHGVLGFTSSLQGDLKTAGIPIRVHSVCPDLVDTKMMRDESDNPEYALGFTAPKLLTPEAVSERIVELLDSDRIILALPRRRMWLTRIAGTWPRASLPMSSLLRKAGERRRAKMLAGR